jgi:hypothetical protein
MSWMKQKYLTMLLIIFFTIVRWAASVNRFPGHTVLMTNVALRLNILFWGWQKQKSPVVFSWYVLHGKAVLTMFTAYAEPMSFVSMLTGAPTSNVFHLKLRDEKKDVTNSSHIELHHHSSAKHKGLLLTFHQTDWRSLLLKHYKTITTYAYVMCDIPPFFLPLFLSQAHVFVFVVTTLSCCTNITLQKHCTVLLSQSSCLSSSSSKVYFSFYLYLNSMLVSCDILLFTILQAHS